MNKNVKIANLKELLLAITSFILFSGIAMAQYDDERVQAFAEGMSKLCVMITTALPIIVIALFALAAIAYAAGQVFGAEMRGRATGWAMNMVVGAVIALIIYLLKEPILSMLWQGPIPENFCK
jgi:hypothetical protein